MTYRALVQYQTGKLPKLEERPLPQLKPGQLLVKVEASTINPVDRAKYNGLMFTEPLPAVLGFEGVGKVVKANGEEVQNWIGKRVTFFQQGVGSWGQYSVTNPLFAIRIQEDIPRHIAASGMINPLTAIGMTDIYMKFPDRKGIINTAASSALGKMLNKRCKRMGIPLLNIVRRQKQADLLKSQGAQFVLISDGDWGKQYSEMIEKHGFNVLFDALGGGPVSETLILSLKPNSRVYCYSHLQCKPLSVGPQVLQQKKITLRQYNFINFWTSINEQQRKKYRQEHNQLLKSEFITASYSTMTLAQFPEAFELSLSKAFEGKITLVP